MSHTYATALIGQGTVLGYDLTGGGTYVPLGQLIDVSTDFAVNVVEYKKLSSTSVLRLPTVFDGGEVSFKIFYEPAETTNVDMWGLMGTPSIVHWKITLTDTSTIAFLGILTKHSVSYENEDVVEAELSIAVSGAVTVVVATT